jgi:hypothetical protein
MLVLVAGQAVLGWPGRGIWAIHCVLDARRNGAWNVVSVIEPATQQGMWVL